MSDATRVPPGGHDYTAEMLAIAIVEAELRGHWQDRRELIRTALAEDPERVIDVLANLYAVRLDDDYDDALRLTNAIRWAILGYDINAGGA
jgi:hypothetical protein